MSTSTLTHVPIKINPGITGRKEAKPLANLVDVVKPYIWRYRRGMFHHLGVPWTCNSLGLVGLPRS